MASITVHEREVAIASFLHEEGPATIRATWEAIQTEHDPEDEERRPWHVGDQASLPTCHRTVAKLVRRGHLEDAGVDESGAALYSLADQLSPLNTFTLTDLEIALWELSPADAMAAYIDAVDYYEANAGRVLGMAAEALSHEHPCDLILRMLQDYVQDLEDDLGDLSDPEASEPLHAKHVETRLKNLSRFVYGEVGLSGKVWKIPSLEDLLAGQPIAPESWATVRSAISRRVFGETFIEVVEAEDHKRGNGPILIVSGSDGSSHAGFVRGLPAAAYTEEEGRLVLTFNNSVAFVDLPPNYNPRFDFPFHGVPMTRGALEDPHNRGMIIARPWYPDLTDSQFEHMKKAALDVVQFRVDERLVIGAARAYGTKPASGGSGLLPRPNILIRDGTVTPQEREFQHYIHPSSYGDITREGIALSYNILREVADSNRRVYAGAVKSTQLRTFSRVINWYIQRGSAAQLGAPIDRNWDVARAAQVTDSVAVSRMLKALPALVGNRYYRTCVVARPFPSMVTDLRHLACDTASEWLEVFQRRQAAAAKEWDDHGRTGERPWLVGVDLADDPYVRLCQRADYAMFYFGRPGGDPQLTFPRFEFMDSLRPLADDEAADRALRNTQLIIDGVHVSKWDLDRDHNFMSSMKLPRLIPYVVSQAHEKCKAIGHKLEQELRQAIAMRLSQIKALKGVSPPPIHLEPLSFRDYARRLRSLLIPESTNGDEDQS